ncbi:hypothetical protein GWI33_003807 [Rhynchophorus ferrugineus]|uniref:Uncharacterized protein n=1 Tax=Rhynchophorus ferrugineus TaxID=354439 RepID=A0A834LWX0_RHYFE|nr:hypothetical protein GWI33_003807 [Rhynchophorus ferrugineus]
MGVRGFGQDPERPVAHAERNEKITGRFSDKRRLQIRKFKVRIVRRAGTRTFPGPHARNAEYVIGKTRAIPHDLRTGRFCRFARNVADSLHDTLTTDRGEIKIRAVMGAEGISVGIMAVTCIGIRVADEDGSR